MQIDAILVPIDFSEASGDALAEAATLAHHYDAELTVYHVHQLETVVFMDFTYVEPPETLAELCAAAEKELTRMVGRLEEQPPRYKVRVATGSPVTEIIRESEGHQLIVMPTHGRTGLKHFLIGSVAERVVQGAQCSVLILKPEQGIAPA